MRRWLTIAGACLSLLGCAPEASIPSTGYLPWNTFNNVIFQDPAISAMQTATFAFAHPAAMQGQPAQMALAIASLDAMAGQLSTGGRWSHVDSLAKLQMLQARTSVRAILGISPAVASQVVVDAMVASAHALDRGDRAAAEAALSAPGFSMPPGQMLALLAHFPAVPLANWATMRASGSLYPGGGGLLTP